MTDSKRLRVLKLLCTWLKQEVTIANGYKHDLRAVVRGRAFMTDEDETPSVAVIEALNPDRDRVDTRSDDDSRTRGLESWVLQFAGWAEEDLDFPCDAAYELMADVKKALAKICAQDTFDANILIDMGGGDTPRAFHLGGLINGLRCEPGTVRPPEQPTEKAFFWMRVILKFSEKVSDPYLYS